MTERDLTLVGAAAGSDLDDLGWLTLRAREVDRFPVRVVAGRDVARDAGFLVELPLFVVPRSSVVVSGTAVGLLTTVRTVVAVTVESSLDDASSSCEHLSFLVFTVDDAKMSANVIIADADVGLSGSDCITSNSSCAFMTSSDLSFNCTHSVSTWSASNHLASQYIHTVKVLLLLMMIMEFILRRMVITSAFRGAGGVFYVV